MATIQNLNQIGALDWEVDTDNSGGYVAETSDAAALAKKFQAVGYETSTSTDSEGRQFLWVMGDDPNNMKPTLTQLVAATNGKLSRDAQSVVVSFGNDGYLRLWPSIATIDGIDMPAARIEGRCERRDGTHHSTVREQLRNAGIYPR